MKHLEVWVESRESKEKPADNILFPPEFGVVDIFLRAEAYFLKGMLDSNPATRERWIRLAIEKYDEIVAPNLWVSRALRAKGWAYMFLFDLDKAHSAFLSAQGHDPKNKSMQKDMDFATSQLKKGFRDLKQILKGEFRFKRELTKFLTDKIGESSYLLLYDKQDYSGRDFIQQAINNLQKAGLSIEENYPRHEDKDEEGLRDEMVQCLKMLNINVSAESKIAKGKRDIVIKDNFTNGELTAECLIWKGKEYYKSKKDQLLERYLTWHNKEAALVTFVRNINFMDIVSTVPNVIKEIPDLIQASFKDLSGEKSRLYVSEHKHKSGTIVRLYHIFFHLPVNGKGEK